MTSLLPTPEPPDPVEGALGHFDHSNWVKAALKALDAGTVHQADANVGGPLGAEEITIDKPSSEEATLWLQGNGPASIRSRTSAQLMRWRMDLGDATAEGGSNSGSRFKLLAYGDTGTLRHTVFDADRNNGLVEVVGPPTTAKGIATKQYVDDSMPLGAIIAYGGSVAPTGWHLCNGSAHGSAALQTLIGSATTPDLSGRFIVGAGTGYNPKQTGGAATVTLSAAQSGLVGHSHAAGSGNNSVGHTHTGATDSANRNTAHAHSSGTMSANWSHAHGEGAAGGFTPQGYLSDFIRMGDDPAGNTYGFLSQTVKQITPSPIAAHTHGISATDVNHTHGISSTDTNHEHGFTTGAESQVHQHAISITAAAAAAAAAAHENLPPYYALVYIIKKV
jgi:microcystin-dependent protein